MPAKTPRETEDTLLQDRIANVKRVPLSAGIKGPLPINMLMKRYWADAVFLLPAFIIFTALVIYPAFSSVYYSMTDWDGLNPDVHFIGVVNFTHLLSDPEVLISIQNTLVFACSVMLLQNTIGLLLALALDKFLRQPFFATLRVLFLTPILMSGLAVSYIWSYMYSPLFGVVNGFFAALGLKGWQHDWLGDPHLALGSVIFANVWQYAGYSMIIFLAGLQLVPVELYEAAAIDGTSSWQRFRAITFPLIAPSFTINIVLTLIGSLKVFDLIYIMTSGGPGTATESILVHIYKEAFGLNNFGYAGAISIVSCIVILLISIVALSILRRREVEL